MKNSTLIAFLSLASISFSQEEYFETINEHNHGQMGLIQPSYYNTQLLELAGYTLPIGAPIDIYRYYLRDALDGTQSEFEMKTCYWLDSVPELARFDYDQPEMLVATGTTDKGIELVSFYED
ncbi:MAG: hypothetical protein HRT57_11395 [Crocinitomicaceae bacterium]|nr:hypothetical protein [Crocinitomicaceae bacterium]